MNNLVRYNNVEYILPFLFCNDIFIPILRELLKDDFHIVNQVYGSPTCVWNTGRTTNFNYVLKNLVLVDSYFRKLKKYEITPSLTFNTINVTDDNLKDEFSNNLLDISYKHNAYFIITNEKLYRHIKSRYPDAKTVCSVILPSILNIEDKNFNETEFYNRMLDMYDIVVLRPEYTLDNIDKLGSLISDINRVEVLINQSCMKNCPYAKKHYELIHDFHLGKMTFDELLSDIKSFCKSEKEGKPIYMSKEIVDRLVGMGIRKLKVQGRDYDFLQVVKELYNSLFNQAYSFEEIKDEIDKICASFIQKNKLASVAMINLYL